MAREYSLIEIFGQLPVEPSRFKKLDPKLKWLGKAVEGDSWCTSCGTLTPKVPRSHHLSCDTYKDADEYILPENPLGRCPECNSEDGLSIESCREQAVSAIHCVDCMYHFSDGVDEETLTERFRKHRASKTL